MLFEYTLSVRVTQISALQKCDLLLSIDISPQNHILRTMKFEKLFGSKTKSDILKYLVFRRQGISMRAFEHELQRSFPAIKKQIDLLEEAGVVTIDKQDAKRAVYLCK